MACPRYYGKFDLSFDEDTKVLRVIELGEDADPKKCGSGETLESCALAWDRVNDLRKEHKGVILQKSSFYEHPQGVVPLVCRNQFGRVNLMMLPEDDKYGKRKKTNYKSIYK